MQDLLLAVEEVLEQAIDAANFTEPTREAVRHSVFPAGKRIRPRFLLALSQDLHRVAQTSAVHRAAAVELLHCASLVHDDLPALDNDLLRRGTPTVHVRFGAGIATLVGDIVSALPFTIPDVPSSPIGKAYIALCHGQILDLKRANSIDELLMIHRLKTGALFRLCAELACSGELDDAIKRAVVDFGELVGIEFQLRNDIADELEGRGSDCSSDHRNQRLNADLRGKLPGLLQSVAGQRDSAAAAIREMIGTETTNLDLLLAEMFSA